MEDDPGGYKEAAAVLKAAQGMFIDHSKAITGHAWKWDDADEQVRVIWIIKAVRANQ